VEIRLDAVAVVLLDGLSYRVLVCLGRWLHRVPT
jgi:hypothetical protein